MKRSVKDRMTKQAVRGKNSGNEMDQIILEKVYVADDLPEAIEIKAVRQSVEIFGGAVIRRFFIKRRGVEKEIYQCSDCELHFTTEDHKENYCALPVGRFEIEPIFLKPVGQMQVCTHICAYKKEQYRELLEKAGIYYEEDKFKGVKEYLGKSFTRHGDDFVLQKGDEKG